MIVEQFEYKVKKWGNGRTNSGPSGRMAARRTAGKDLGAAFHRARKRPIWELLAHEGNSMVKKGQQYELTSS